MHSEPINRNELLYRKSGRALLLVLGLWVGAMLLALALPSNLWKSVPLPFVFFAGIFPLLFLVAVVLGVVRMVAYIRWTGKYPYYFLFKRRRGSGDTNP